MESSYKSTEAEGDTKPAEDTSPSSTNTQKKLSSDKDIVTGTCQSTEEDVTTISDLPEEVLHYIFTYLEHGDLLTSRLVNKTWNTTITNFQRFPTTKMIYVINPRLGEDSQKTLIKSTVPWRSLSLENFIMKKCVTEWYSTPELTLPAMLPPFVKSLELMTWDGVAWNRICRTLMQFPALEELQIIDCRFNKMKKSDFVEIQGSLTESLKNLKSISLVMKTDTDMTYSLKQFNSLNVSNLVNISLKGTTTGQIAQDSRKNAAAFLSEVLTLIQNSSKTLKSLAISVGSFSVVGKFFPEVVQELIGRVDLKTFSIEFTGYNADQANVDIFTRFIKSQKNLREIHLPNTENSQTESWNEMVKAVNKDVRKVHVPFSCSIQLHEELLEQFPDLSHLTFGAEFEDNLSTIGEDSYPKMRTLEYKNSLEGLNLKLLVVVFPNLTKLFLHDHESSKYNRINYRFVDSDLQAIIQNLKKLKYLVLGNCDQITDSGVTGLKKKYLYQVWKSTIELRSAGGDIVETPTLDQVNGSPISSLTGLTHLTLCQVNNLKDVGIFYGFRFQELRHLRMTMEKYRRKNLRNITVWGLQCLAKLNPDLDSAYFGYLRTDGHFRSESESEELAIKKFRTHFRRINDHNFAYEEDSRKKCCA